MSSNNIAGKSVKTQEFRYIMFSFNDKIIYKICCVTPWAKIALKSNSVHSSVSYSTYGDYWKREINKIHFALHKSLRTYSGFSFSYKGSVHAINERPRLYCVLACTKVSSSLWTWGTGGSPGTNGSLTPIETRRSNRTHQLAEIIFLWII